MTAAVPSALFLSRVLDPKDPLDAEWEQAFRQLHLLLQDAPEAEVVRVLQQRSSQSTEAHQAVCTGLTYLLLVDDDKFDQAVQYLSLVVRDEFAHVAKCCSMLLSEKMHKLLSGPRKQVH